LDLTDKQKQLIRHLLEANKKEIAKTAKDVITKKRELREVVLAEQTDEKAIRKSADELSDTIGDAAVKMSKLARQIRGVLTDKQVKQVQKFRSENQLAVDKFFEKILAE